jgi:hypothetical protein
MATAWTQTINSATGVAEFTKAGESGKYHHITKIELHSVEQGPWVTVPCEAVLSYAGTSQTLHVPTSWAIQTSWVIADGRRHYTAPYRNGQPNKGFPGALGGRFPSTPQRRRAGQTSR